MAVVDSKCGIRCRRVCICVVIIWRCGIGKGVADESGGCGVRVRRWRVMFIAVRGGNLISGSG